MLNQDLRPSGMCSNHVFLSFGQSWFTFWIFLLSRCPSISFFDICLEVSTFYFCIIAVSKPHFRYTKIMFSYFFDEFFLWYLGSRPRDEGKIKDPHPYPKALSEKIMSKRNLVIKPSKIHPKSIWDIDSRRKFHVDFDSGVRLA